MRKRALVVVEWDDIAAYDNWRGEDDSHNWTPLRCVSVGWKMPSNRRSIILAATRSESGQCTDRQVIPSGCVIKIRRLE